MSKSLSLDLRIRVLKAVAGGMSCRQAAERFGVSAASAIRWRSLERSFGDARPKALGGDRRSGRIEAHATPAYSTYFYPIEKAKALLRKTAARTAPLGKMGSVKIQSDCEKPLNRNRQSERIPL